MCTCGCGEGNDAFKLRAPDGGWYVIELRPGCHYCSSGPGLAIRHPDANYEFDDHEYLPELPWIGEGEFKMALFKSGLDADEARTAAIKSLVYNDDECKVDEGLAEILGYEFWQNHLTESPSLIKPIK